MITLLRFKHLLPVLLCLCLQATVPGQEKKGASVPSQKDAQIFNLKGHLVIDGDSKDWQVPATALLSSKDGKAQMRFAADYNNFYAFVEVEDPSPLKNAATAPEEMFKGGDTVAFYFKTQDGDEQRVAACLRNEKNEVYVYRPKSGNKKPYTFKSPVGEARFDYVAPAEGAQVSFRKYDGKGYCMEICLPWRNTLGIWKHRPEKFNFDAQVVFSDPGGMQNAGAIWLFTKEGPGLTIEDLPTEARLYPDTWGDARYVDSIAISADKPVLAIGKPTGGADIEVELPRPGRLSLNITDNNGWILRELVMATEFTAGRHVIHWDGRDRYGEPLPAGSYQWKALLFDGMKADFMGSVGSSGRPPYRTPDGLGAIGGQHGPQKSVASDAGGIYMANACEEGQPSIRKINPQTGAALWKRSAGGFKTARHIAAGDGMACIINTDSTKSSLVRIDPDTGKDIPMGTAKGASARAALELPPDGNAVDGLAIVGGKAYFSVPAENRIGAVDLSSGTVENDIGCKSPAPQGLSRLNDTTLLICSGKQVIAWDIAKKTGRAIVDKLEAPKAVCADARGILYVSDLGSSQQIRKFSSDGKLITAFGIAGGRGVNSIPYNPLSFVNITSMTVGVDGNIWLAEVSSPPKRFIKLNPEGKWLEDFYGPVAYNTFGPDLDDVSRVFYNCGGNAKFVETKIDYDLYRKNPMDPAAAWKIVSIQDLGLGADGVTRNPAMSDVADNGYGHVIAFKAANGNKYLFRMSKGNRASNPLGAGLWIWKGDRWIPSAFISRNPGKNSKTPQNDFSWADQNGDGLIQDEEKYIDPDTEETAWIDRDLTLHGLTGKWASANTSGCGAPKYQRSSFTPYVKEGESNYWGKGGSYNFVSYEKDGSVYYICNIGPHRHMSFWDRATENRLIKIKDGKAEWIAGSHSTIPGLCDFTTVSGIAGIVDGIVLAHNIEPANYVGYTEDGFVLGDVLLNENGIHPKVGGNVINIENFTGLFIKDPKTEKKILFAVSSGDDRIIEISGPGRTTRLNGTIKLGTASQFGEKQPITIPYSNWYGNVTRGIGIDGEYTEWNPNVPGVSIVEKGEVIGDVSMRRDAGILNVFATVSDPTPFEEGDGVEITLSKTNDPSKAVTLLLSSTAKDSKGRRIGTAKLSRNGAPVESRQIKVGVSERWINLGYRIEAAITLELLPEFTVQAEKKFRSEIKNEKTGKEEIKSGTEKVADLASPLYGSIRIIRMKDGKALSTQYSQQLTPVRLP